MKFPRPSSASFLLPAWNSQLLEERGKGKEGRGELPFAARIPAFPRRFVRWIRAVDGIHRVRDTFPANHDTFAASWISSRILRLRRRDYVASPFIQSAPPRLASSFWRRFHHRPPPFCSRLNGDGLVGGFEEVNGVLWCLDDDSWTHFALPSRRKGTV